MPAYQIGGISQYTLFLISALAELDPTHAYHIFHSWRDSYNYTPLRANFRRRILFTPCHHRLEKWTLSGEIRLASLFQRFDLWHSPDFIPPLWAAKKLVITVHDLNFLYYPQYLTSESQRYYVDQIAWAAQKADHLLADSHHTRQDLLEHLHLAPSKVTTVHLAANPIYTRSLQPSAIRQTLASYNLPKGFILFVGTLEPRKNIPLLLQAYSQLRQEYKVDLPLVLVGRKGWLYEEIFTTIAELGLAPFVHHLSGVGDIQLAYLYAAAGILAFPSQYEGFGLPPLEAMHVGCPVVVSNRASLPEVVGDAGILLPPNDPAAWANALYRVLTDSQLHQQLIEKGHTQAQQFSWSATAEKTLQIYQMLNSQS